jgi:hypothetical protein
MGQGNPVPKIKQDRQPVRIDELGGHALGRVVRAEKVTTQSFQVLGFLVQGIQLEGQGYSGDLLSVVLKTPFVEGVHPVQTYGQTAYFPGRDKASGRVAGFRAGDLRAGDLRGLGFFITLMAS